MTVTPHKRAPIHLALDVMGGDGGVEAMVAGLELARARGLRAKVTLHGREGEIKTALASRDFTDSPPDIVHAEDVITMTDKPTYALRRGRGSSMWSAIASVKDGSADAAISAGNTGALMAMSVLQLRMIEGVDRPAITATWPTMSGRTAVLDVGANVEANSSQLVQFAIMGEAYFRALTGKAKPSVGLLNVGAEELKGHDLIRRAADTLRDAAPDIDFKGFVEGDDITTGDIDVVVTDGFTGNVALKTAEGVARLLGGWIKEALTQSWRSKLGATMMMPELRALKDRMNPSRENGAPLLGLNGLVIKSHGGADAEGVASALNVAQSLSENPFKDEVAQKVANIKAPASDDADPSEDVTMTAAAE